MWFYLVFISLICEKASEINLQAGIFISILLLCQRFIQTTASWEGLLWKLIPAPRQTDSRRLCKGLLPLLRSLSHSLIHSLFLQTLLGNQQWNQETTTEIQKQRCAPRASALHQLQKLHEPKEHQKFWWMVMFTFDARPVSCLWRVSQKLAWNGKNLHHNYPPCVKERKVFFDYNTDQGNSDGLLRKAYPFTIHLYKPRTASSLFITWLHSSSIAGNHYPAW